MRSASINMLAAAIACTLGTSCTLQPPQGKPVAPSPAAVSISNKVHTVVNDYRRQQGLEPLNRHRGLDEIALGHTRYLLDKRGTSILNGRNVTHFGSGTRAATVHRRYGMPAYGENLAAIASQPQDPANHLLLMWRTSFGHNKNLVGHWTDTGIATLIDKDGMIFCTQVFGLESAATTPSPPASR